MTANYPQQHIEVRFGDSVDQFLFGRINIGQVEWLSQPALMRVNCGRSSRLNSPMPCLVAMSGGIKSDHPGVVA